MGTISSFPAVDPIPIPAPIWLVKLLHIVTLSLHFIRPAVIQTKGRGFSIMRW